MCCYIALAVFTFSPQLYKRRLTITCFSETPSFLALAWTASTDWPISLAISRDVIPDSARSVRAYPIEARSERAHNQSARETPQNHPLPLGASGTRNDEKRHHFDKIDQTPVGSMERKALTNLQEMLTKTKKEPMLDAGG